MAVGTPRFRDLTPRQAAAVVSSFLGGKSDVEFTEKLAGQHLTAVKRPSSSEWYFLIKSGEEGYGGFFPAVEDALNRYHPESKFQLTYEFEVVNRRDRPDYIDYDLKTDAAVEYTGAMTPSVAKLLNSRQKRVKFLTKADISKPVEGLITNPKTKKFLRDFVKEASAKDSISKSRMLEVEAVLMQLIDSGKVPSSLGGSRVEGLFGKSGDVGFKIPSKEYADLQLQQARFYAIVRKSMDWEVISRFEKAVKDPRSDKVVADILDYIDKLASGGIGPGFRVFFSTSEAKRLQKLSARYLKGDAQAGIELARTLFSRIRDRDSWVSSGIRESSEINETNSPSTHGDRYSENSLLRTFIRRHIR